MPKIKKVYIGTITPEAWEPGSNTVAYFPMRGDFKDYSGGGYDLSITDGSYTLGNEYNTVTNIGGKNTSFTYSTSSSYTLSCWANLTSSANILFLGSDSASGRGMTVSAQQAACVVNDTQYSTTTATGKLNERCLYTAVFDYTNHKIIYYQNTEKIAEATTSSGGIRGGRWITLNKGSDYASANLNGKLGQMVCENVAWSDNDIADYYNRSRYNYEDMPKYIEIWPGEEKDNWLLFDESDFATSTPSKNSQFHYSGWNGTTYWTNTSYDTTNKRIYANNSHCLAGFILNDSTALVGAKKIKIVGDYAYCYNSNTYSSGFHLMPFNLSMTYSLSVNGETGTTYSPALNTFLTHSTPYSSEFIYDFDTDSGTLKVTNLSNQTETQCTVTGFKQYWDSKVNSGSLELFSMYKDQGSSSYLGDYHIYYVPGGEPAPQGGSVDFTTTSRAALSADGWTYTNNTPGLDSGGFYCSNTSNDKGSRLWHPINLSNANKIYIKTVVNGSNSSWAGGPSFGIAKDTAHSYPYVSGNLSFTSQSGYNYQGLYVNPDGTDLVSKNNFNIGGTYTLEITVDFDAKKVYYNLNGAWSTEIGMSNSVVSAIRQCAYIKCEAAHGIYSGARIKSFEWDIT